jgi:acyl-CoA dehydrogenase
LEILKYTGEHHRYRERLRAFLEEEVIPFADGWERAGMVPRSIWRRMGEEGYLCTQVEREYGGPGLDFLYSVVTIEELARTRQTGLAAPLHSDVVVPYIASFGSEEIKKRYLPRCVSGEIITAIAMTEPDAGSDLSSMRTTAVEEGECVVVNGEKTFISNGIHCDLLVLAARDPGVEDPYRGIDLYAVEAGSPGFEKGKRLSKMGWHSQDTAELLFRDCRIPVGNRLGTKGGGFLMLMEKLQQERLMCAVMAVAAAEYILDATVAFCREKAVSGKAVSRSQEVQFRIVDMATEARLGRTFVEKLIADHMEGRPIVVEASMAKSWTTDMAMRIADRSLELHGLCGCCEDYPPARAWRDARVMSIFAGTNEIMKGIAAKFMGL